MEEGTKIEELERKLREARQALAEAEQALANERLVSAQRLRLGELGQIAVGIGHELRQPLSVISTAAYCIRAAAGPLPDRQATAVILRHLDRLDAQLAEAARTITALMDYARTQQPKRCTVDLNGMVSRQSELRDLPAGVRLLRELVQAPAEVMADPSHLERVFHILLQNAVDSLDGAAGEVILRTFTEDHAAGFEVRDTGAGVPDELRERIFQPFTTTKAHGIGIGLALARLLVESNAGSIGFASRPGAGSVFHVRLPRPA